MGGAVHAAPSDPDKLDAAREALRGGRYEAAVEQAGQELPDSQFAEAWWLVRLEGLLARGQYPAAAAAATNALANHPRSIRIWWQAREAFQRNGDPAAADRTLEQIAFYVNLRPDWYRDTPDRIVIGRAALAQGADPKLVLDRVYVPARGADPTLREVYLAGGELALNKHDYALAAQWFRDGLEQVPDDPDLLYGLARAYAPSEVPLMMESAAAALEGNPHHAGCLLLMADGLITAENYDGAEELLARVLEVNPWHSGAWAYRAVLAHLRNQPDQEEEARATGLKYWPTNPEVDYLLGRKLSEKYRFVEGATCQYRALDLDLGYLPARAQLASDLLRLGWEDEGWEVAEQVQQTDEYDVTANNLMTLRDVIADYQTLTNEQFVVRMHPQEAPLYGSRVLDLLGEAYETLGERYGRLPADPTLVEVFREQKDFAVRTFGMPLNQGFLGVCFGRVITANSPGSRAGMAFNWESMLWHEYCHVVTLQITQNKMPRWLSEGISVYEERVHNPAWGEQLTPAYREMLLGEDLTPVSELSAAFMTPRSGEHLMFAYYQSSLVVEYLVNQYGHDSLVAILNDLGDGLDIVAAIERNTAPMKQIDREFVAYAHDKARSLAPGLDWSKPGGEGMLGRLSGWLGRDMDMRSILERQGAEPDEAAAADPTSTNFWVMVRQAGELVEAEQYAEAQPILRRLIDLFPSNIGPGSAYDLLVRTHQALGETEQEREVLAAWAARDDEAVDAYRRLMELGAAADDWEMVGVNAERYLAVNPLIPLPYRHLAEAAEALGRPEAAAAALRAVLHLDPANPAAVHYALARALHGLGEEPDARRHVLLALEEAPRFREALTLLLELQAPEPAAEAPPPDAGGEAS